LPDKIVQVISDALFPQGDDEGLITDEEILDKVAEQTGVRFVGFAGNVRDFVDATRKAQRDLTTRLKDAEHQQKVKRIHKDLVALQLDCGNVYELSRRLEEYVSSMLSRILGNPPS